LKCYPLSSLFLFLALIPQGQAGEQKTGYLDSAGAWQRVDHSPSKRGSFQSKAGGVKFSVFYDDIERSTRFGFDDPSLGEIRRKTLDAVLIYLGGLLAENGMLEIQVKSSLDDPSAPVATGAPYFAESAGFFGGYPFEHLTLLVDPCREDNCGSDLADMELTVNFGLNFNSGLGAPAADEYDLYTVLLHQISHGLGLTSLAAADGSSSTGNGTLTLFDQLLQTADGTPLWNGDGSFAVTASDLSQGQVVFAGSEAETALGSKPAVYTPDLFVAGASLSHWDAAIADGAVLAEPIAPGQTQRAWSTFEIAALRDLGYRINTGTTLVFPWVSNSDTFESTVVINNYGGSDARIVLSATREDGSSELLETQTIPAYGFLSSKAENLFARLGTGNGYTVLLRSDVSSIRGRWITNDRPGQTPSQGVAIEIPSGGATSQRLGQTIVFGYLPGNKDFQSIPVVVNTGSEPIYITFYYFKSDGTLFRTAILDDARPLTPSLGLLITETEGDLYAVARSSGAPITGVVFVFNADLGYTAIGNATAVDNFTLPDE